MNKFGNIKQSEDRPQMLGDRDRENSLVIRGDLSRAINVKIWPYQPFRQDEAES